MPLFSRFKNKGSQPTSKDKTQGINGNDVAPRRPTYQSRWESTTIVPAEVMELVHTCTAEMKSRAEALDAPFVLLPFRPDSDPISARTFIRNYYKANSEGSSQYRGEALKQELRLTDSVVLCSIMKWCWSRMPSGVVTWPVYEGFRIGEKEADMARNAFNTFIPIGADSEARRSIIFDFFDLLAAVAAHGKLNGLGGRKLSRLAGWWAFEHSDDGKGFEGGYKSWQTAADASSHLFFAYLRSLSPDTDPSMNVIERIPRSLQALVASTEYPPETPTLLQRSTPRVVMVVDNVSPTPFALLRRAKNFEYRDRDRVLREFAEFEDPIDALTEECKRVLYAVSSTNQSVVASSRQGLPGLPKPDESWSAFQNMGFSDIDEKALTKTPNGIKNPTQTVGQGLRSEPASRGGAFGDRPTTPSWADFLSSGFADDGTAKSPTLLYPPAQVLPPLMSRSASAGRLTGIDETLAPGELAAITNVELDDAFWWVWMTSLAGEEPTERKSVFGRCALIETTIMNGKWLIMEEQLKGAAPDPAEGAFIAPKKSMFSFSKRGRLGRKRSSKQFDTTSLPARALSATPSKTSITTDQHAKIKAAARALTSPKEDASPEAIRRGRLEDGSASKTVSTMTTGLGSEAGPAMQWAKAYDKHAIRSAYLGDNLAGTGVSREDLVRKISSNTLNSDAKVSSPRPAPLNLEKTEKLERDLPPVPPAEPVAAPAEPPVLAPPPAEDPPVSPVAPSPEKPAAAEPTVQPETLQALEREPDISPPVSPVVNHFDRKPVASSSPAVHPATRTRTNPEQDSAPATPSKSPAFLAAQAAMQSRASASPESNKLKKGPTTNNAGLRKFFGKKTTVNEPPRQNSQPAALVPPAENGGIGRRFSQMRKNKAPATSKNQPKPANAAAIAAATAAASQEPVLDMSSTNNPDYPSTELSRSSTREEADAVHEFGRFDQGPLMDVPSAAPVESEDDRSPPAHQTEFNKASIHPDAFSQPAPEAHGTPEPVAEHDHFIAPPEFAPPQQRTLTPESEKGVENPYDPQVVQDRWATIRENAHRRAKRGSEDQSTRSHLSQSQRTDDGETSGEETIESRVARIKARVAELTGNMDSAVNARP